MRYATEDACRRARVNLDACGSIHRSGSVAGMQARYGWPKGGQLRVGSYVYNVGAGALDRLRAAGDLRGEG